MSRGPPPVPGGRSPEEREAARRARDARARGASGTAPPPVAEPRDWLAEAARPTAPRAAEHRGDRRRRADAGVAAAWSRSRRRSSRSASAWFPISLFQPFKGDGRRAGAGSTIPQGSSLRQIADLLEQPRRGVELVASSSCARRLAGQQRRPQAGLATTLRTDMSFAAALDALEQGVPPNVVAGHASPRASRAAEIGAAHEAGCGATTCARAVARRPQPARLQAPSARDEPRGLPVPGHLRAQEGPGGRASSSTEQLADVQAELRQGGPGYARTQEPHALRRAHHRVAGRARGDGGEGAAADRLGDLQPAARRHPARHRRHASASSTGNWKRAAHGSPSSQNPSPYNTRMHAGLPPGPIGNPGLASIKAAAHPAKTDYLFYVVKPWTAAASTPSPRPTPSSRRYVDALQPRARGARRQVAHELLTALAGVLGFPVGHSRSPGDDERGLRRARARLALRRAAGSARALRGDRAAPCPPPATAGPT